MDYSQINEMIGQHFSSFDRLTIENRKVSIIQSTRLILSILKYKLISELGSEIDKKNNPQDISEIFKMLDSSLNYTISKDALYTESEDFTPIGTRDVEERINSRFEQKKGMHSEQLDMRSDISDGGEDDNGDKDNEDDYKEDDGESNDQQKQKEEREETEEKKEKKEKDRIAEDVKELSRFARKIPQRKVQIFQPDSNDIFRKKTVKQTGKKLTMDIQQNDYRGNDNDDDDSSSSLNSVYSVSLNSPEKNRRKDRKKDEKEKSKGKEPESEPEENEKSDLFTDVPQYYMHDTVNRIGDKKFEELLFSLYQNNIFTTVPHRVYRMLKHHQSFFKSRNDIDTCTTYSLIRDLGYIDLIYQFFGF